MSGTHRTPTVADGSARADAPPVSVRRHGPERYRWRCPRGHADWAMSSDGRAIHCYQCRREHTLRGAGDREIYDARRQRAVEAERVEVVAGKQWSTRRTD